MDNNYLQLDQLSVGYGENVLIKDICLDIKRGEIVTVIGPNGAGKSTILKSISKHLAILGGKVLCDGIDLKELSYKDLSKKMSLVLTDRIKPELMTCHEIVATGRYPYTGRFGILSFEDEKKVEYALSTVHAQDLGARDFNTISDGQKQRILLARAICQEPEIIVLDEPTSFLDIRYKLELLGILRSMATTQNISIVMTLHEIDLAQKISDKIVCVSYDHIVEYGTPEEIFRDELIRSLYNIDNGFYNPVFGNIELPPPDGTEPRYFVISSGGTGVQTYRELQKKNIPFAAGVLYKNDIDYDLARFLACKIVTEQSFSAISDKTFREAVEVMQGCEKVIYAGVKIGECNRRLLDLVETARRDGKLKSTD